MPEILGLPATLTNQIRKAQSIFCMSPCPLPAVPSPLALPATLNKSVNHWGMKMDQQVGALKYIGATLSFNHDYDRYMIGGLCPKDPVPSPSSFASGYPFALYYTTSSRCSTSVHRHQQLLIKTQLQRHRTERTSQTSTRAVTGLLVFGLGRQ